MRGEQAMQLGWRRSQKVLRVNGLRCLGTDEKERNMARAGTRASSWGMGWVWWVVVLGAGRLAAEEPASAFLNALRENQYNDAALLYLDRMEADPRTPAEFRQEIPYQRGVTMIQAASLERDRAVRESRLNAAKENLERFLREQPDHPKKSSARRQFGFLLREWARMKMEQAARTGEATMRKEAAGLYDQAYQVFDNAATELKDQLAKLKEQPDLAAGDGASEHLESLRAEYLDSLLRRAETLEDKADTEPADSAERKKLLNDAIQLYGEMYSKYHNRLAGVQARLNEARSLVKLGEFDKALKYVDDDVINQADVNPPLGAQAHHQGVPVGDGLLAARIPPGVRRGLSRAPRRGSVRSARPRTTIPTGCMLKLQLAKANRAYADQLQAKDPRDPQIKAARDEARKLARAVARMPGGNQEEARNLLAGIPGGVAGATGRAEAGRDHV